MRTRNSELADKRETAKIAMAASLGVLVATGFVSGMRGGFTPAARTLHLCAGTALVGFSYWHWSLYRRPGDIQGRYP